MFLIVRERQLRVVVNKKKHALLGGVEVQKEDERVNVVEKERKKKGWSGRKEKKRKGLGGKKN